MRCFVLFFGCILLFSCGEDTRFERLDASVTGIDFNNEIIEKDTFNILRNEYMYNGGGVGVADLNNDGLSDLVFTGNKVSTRIYLNTGNFKFRDITEKFGGLTSEHWISGVAVADVNADGLADLYFSATMSKDSVMRKNQLWINQGAGQDGLPFFEEMAEQYGIADMGYSMHAAFFDYDLDGDLDLYVLNNIVNKEVPTNYRPKIMDGTAMNNDQFYRNNGDGHFTNVTKAAGIIYEGFGLGLAIGDVNQDGYPDIYVSNDYISNDLLYINQRDGTFRNEAKNFISYQSKFSMGNDMSDVNNDGYLDIITVDMLPEQYARKKQTINGNSYFIYKNDEKYGYEHQYVRNMLQVHNGFVNGEMLPFSEVGQLAGIYQTEWSWSPLFADYDNDGDRDLLVTNGFPKDLTDKDFTNYKAQMYGYLAGDYDIIPRIPIVKVSNYAFENTGDLRFVNQTAAWGMEIPSFSNGAAFADLDNDGDLDYVTNNINDPAFIYRNNTREKSGERRNYLRLAFKGSGENTMAIGAKAEVWSKGNLHYQENYLSRGYISSVEPVMHFGIGETELIDSVKITWPDGKRITLLKNVKPNQLLVLEESKATLNTAGALVKKQGNTLFTRLENAISYTHLQEDYIDFFQNQRIIQHKFSQIGPCSAKGDLNGDGIDDLLVGGSAEVPATVFIRNGREFIKMEFPGLTGKREYTEADLAIVDFDGDGDKDVIAAAGGYANENENDYKHLLYRNNGGTFEQMELPLPAFPASVIKPYDFDKDGDVDFFIGGRVKKGSFPNAPASFLLVNHNGQLSTDENLKFDLGMITDAVWSDTDGDGWKDLILTREWNSVSILKNREGKSFEPVESEDLINRPGLWSCLAAGDLDGDDDDDYVLGNLGENHRFHVSEDFPMTLYAVDIDKNGAIDPITSAYWKDANGEMAEYPVNYLDELAAQSPFFRKKFTSYTQFSQSTMDSILNKNTLKNEERHRVNTTSSYILWNEGAGNFTWERLPTAVQTAPVKRILFRDLNGDNKPDLLLAGNDHSFDVSTGLFDANRGLVLVNQDKRKFRTLPASESGLELRGQVASLEYFDGAPSLLVVGINRGAIRVYEQKQ